ncbi:PD40 domain-containing protein, partial [Candidatus Poribacteria bacterium]|nr:PD40 domain-containing protein [Candidatus Poribacteria bacterium]
SMLPGFGDDMIDVIDLETKQIRRLVGDRYNRHPAWSPDGSKIAFSRDDGIGNIYVMNSDGSNMVKLTDGQGAKRAPAWSPDGQHIVYEWFIWKEEKQGLDYDLFVIDILGATPRRLTDTLGLDGQPDWFDPATLPVERKDKLPTTWGQLKLEP